MIGSGAHPVDRSALTASIGVVVLVVPLVLELVDLAHDLPGAGEDRRRVLHVVELGGRALDRPAPRILCRFAESRSCASTPTPV